MSQPPGDSNRHDARMIRHRNTAVHTDADVGSDAVPVRGRGLDLERDMAWRHVAQGRRQQGVLRHCGKSMSAEAEPFTGIVPRLRGLQIASELAAMQLKCWALARRCSLFAWVSARGEGGSADNAAARWQLR